MLCKRNVTDHLSNDPVIRSDIADRIFNRTENNEVPPLLHGEESDPHDLLNGPVHFERSSISTAKVVVFIAMFAILAFAILGLARTMLL